MQDYISPEDIAYSCLIFNYKENLESFIFVKQNHFKCTCKEIGVQFHQNSKIVTRNYTICRILCNSHTFFVCAFFKLPYNLKKMRKLN